MERKGSLTDPSPARKSPRQNPIPPPSSATNNTDPKGVQISLSHSPTEKEMEGGGGGKQGGTAEPLN